MEHRDDRETPWTEQQWEEFMRAGDLRAARYGELMETLLDHPERDEIIDREMGWDRKRDDDDREWLAELQEALADNDDDEEDDEDEQGDDLEAPSDDAPAPDAQQAVPLSQSEQLERMRHRRRGELNGIPAYALCEEASKLIDVVIQPLLNASQDEDHDLAEAYVQIKIAAAKIAGGHGMGYEDEMLGGNVVNCKRSLAAAGQCKVAVQQLTERRVITSQQARPLLAAVERAETAIEHRIAELRGRMWWQHK